MGSGLIGLAGYGRKKLLATHCRQERRKNMKQPKYSLMPLLLTFLLFIIGLGLIPLSMYASDNPNTITFENRSGECTLVKLMGPTGQTVEVPHGESRTVNVAAGEYYLLVRYGSKPGTYAYTKGDAFTVTQTKTQYSVITITLHKVVGGNYPAHPISSEVFDNAPVVWQNVDRSEPIKTLTPILPPPTIQLPPPAIHLPPPAIHLPQPTIQLPPPTIQFPPPTINIPPPTVNLPPFTFTPSPLISRTLNSSCIRWKCSMPQHAISSRFNSLSERIGLSSGVKNHIFESHVLIKSISDVLASILIVRCAWADRGGKLTVGGGIFIVGGGN